MSIDERSRHELYVRLEEVLGVDHATVLMEHLSTDRDLATKADLKELSTKAELRELAAAMATKDGLKELATKAELRELAAAMATKVDLKELATKAELGSMKHELTATFRKELGDAIATQTRTMVLSLFSAVATSGALAFAAARLV